METYQGESSLFNMESAMRQSRKKEVKGKKTNKVKTQDAKPRKRVIRRRLGIDGKPEAIVTSIDFAPVHPMYLKCPLFTSVKNGSENAGTAVDSFYTAPCYRTECRFIGPQALCIRDQSVLLALCQLGAQASQRILVDKEHPEWSQLSPLLQATGLCADASMIALTVTASQIARIIGLNSSGTNSRSVEHSLQRLSTVVLHRTVLPLKSNLQSFAKFQSKIIGCAPLGGKKMRVVLSAELTYRCTHHNGVSWVNMEDQRALASPPGKRLHAFLSAWASSNEFKCIGLDKLPAHIYGRGECEATTMKARRLAVRKAIAEIATLPGWWCEVLERTQQLKIRKPIFAGTQSVDAMALTNAAITPPPAAIALPGDACKANNDGGFQGSQKSL